jgi:hypothetical protein
VLAIRLNSDLHTRIAFACSAGSAALDHNWKSCARDGRETAGKAALTQQPKAFQQLRQLKHGKLTLSIMQYKQTHATCESTCCSCRGSTATATTGAAVLVKNDIGRTRAVDESVAYLQHRHETLHVQSVRMSDAKGEKAHLRM